MLNVNVEWNTDSSLFAPLNQSWAAQGSVSKYIWKFLKRFPDSSVSSLIRAGWWCEEGHPVIKTSLQYPWVDNWLMTIFPSSQVNLK